MTLQFSEFIDKAWPPIAGAICGFLFARLNLLWDESRKVDITVAELNIKEGPQKVITTQRFPAPNSIYFHGRTRYRVVIKNKSTISKYLHGLRFDFYVENKPVAGFSIGEGNQDPKEPIDVPARKEISLSRDFEFWSSVAIENLQSAKLKLTYMVGEKPRVIDIPFKYVKVKYA